MEKTSSRKSLEFIQGELIAEQHIRAGRLRLRMCGTPAPWAEEYARLLRVRCGVDVQFESCFSPGEPDGSYVAGYNCRMEKEIAARFGDSVLKDTVEQAKIARKDTG